MKRFLNRSTPLSWVLLAFGLALAPVGIYAQKDSANQPAISFVLPTDEDKKLAQDFRNLVKDLDRPFDLTRDMIDGMRNNQLDFFLGTLESEIPVNSRILARARNFVQSTFPRLEQAKTIKAPLASSIPKTVDEITINGTLNELSWKRATQSQIQFKQWGIAKGPTAVAKLLWDSEYLYAGISVPDSNIIAPELKRDSEVWRYDCIEIFLMPDKESGKYWEIEISPTGSILDYLCQKNLNGWGSEFQTDATLEGMRIGRTIRGKANVEGKDDGYIIEVAIPFSQLPGFTDMPKEGSRFYALLGWVNNDNGAPNNTTTSLAQVPFLTWFHNVWAYQPFELSSNTFKPVMN